MDILHVYHNGCFQSFCLFYSKKAITYNYILYPPLHLTSTLPFLFPDFRAPIRTSTLLDFHSPFSVLFHVFLFQSNQNGRRGKTKRKPRSKGRFGSPNLGAASAGPSPKKHGQKHSRPAHSTAPRSRAACRASAPQGRRCPVDLIAQPLLSINPALQPNSQYGQGVNTQFFAKSPCEMIDPG